MGLQNKGEVRRRNFISMRHTFLVVTVKRWLKSVYIYGSYRKTRGRVRAAPRAAVPRAYAAENQRAGKTGRRSIYSADRQAPASQKSDSTQLKAGN